MAQTRDASSFHPSSPHSSNGGADSYKHEGTPDTRLTAFSPENDSARSAKLLRTLSLTASEPSPVRFSVSTPEGYQAISATVRADKDPFVNSVLNTAKSEQKLSPTASAFRPVSSGIVADGTTQGLPGNDGTSASEMLDFADVPSALSTDRGISRCLVISPRSQVPIGADADSFVPNLMQKLANLRPSCLSPMQIHSTGGKVYLHFGNIRDAFAVHRDIQLDDGGWKVEFLAPTEFISALGLVPDPSSIYEGQISVGAYAQPGVDSDQARVEAAIMRLLKSEGDLLAFQRQQSLTYPSVQIVVEYYDAALAMKVITKYNGHVIEGSQLVLSLHKPGENASFVGVGQPLPAPSPRPSAAQDIEAVFRNLVMGEMQRSNRPLAAILPTIASSFAFHLNNQFTPPSSVYRNHVSAISPYYMDQFMSRVPHTLSMANNLPLMGPVYAPMSSPSALAIHQDYAGPRTHYNNNRFEGRRQNAMRVNRSTYYNAAGHHNHVDVNRIREGIDVRTTIMLRNIPNKVDQAMLKGIVDESSWGKYDFMYLRIDFANDCNVGYAFINFVDPLDIIDFVNARGNQRWNCFKSDKVAEISYATIQGKDCLVQKFRNSSVMLEAPHYRPKLYFTSNGPVPNLAGNEEPFPEPDNQSKMKRSCENAEHVGLFTPNAGQHFRDEQRRRRSQYDRGTRLAALEEYDYETATQQLYTPN